MARESAISDAGLDAADGSVKVLHQLVPFPVMALLRVVVGMPGIDVVVVGGGDDSFVRDQDARNARIHVVRALVVRTPHYFDPNAEQDILQ